MTQIKCKILKNTHSLILQYCTPLPPRNILYNKLIFVIILLSILPVILYAQEEIVDSAFQNDSSSAYSTAFELETVLHTSKITCEQAAFFLLNSTDITFSGSAFEYASSKGWLKNKQPDDPITLSTLSFFMMKAFDINGIMMYRLYPSPRYAYRTMVSRSFIQGKADPKMIINGERFLLILGNILSSTGSEQ